MNRQTLRRTAARALALSSVACLVGCDHATKLAAERALRAHEPMRVVPGVVDLAYTENHGVAFSVLERLSLQPPAWVLVATALLTTIVVTTLWVRGRRGGLLLHAGYALIVAGALGNAIDRIARGHVIDFVHVRFWPVFNVADVLIVVGAGLLAVGKTRVAAAPPAPR